MKPKTFDGLAILPMGDMALLLWTTPSRVERGRWLYDRVEEVMAQNPEGVMILQVVLPSASPPDGPMREENHMRLRRWAPTLRRLVTVPLGNPIWMNIVRTIMRAMFVFTGNAHIQHVAQTEREGLDILMPYATAKTPSRKELEAGLVELYRSLGVAREAYPQPFAGA